MAVALLTNGQPVSIEGYTDSKGSQSRNMDLSQRRAESVRTYLISRGLPADQVVAKGMGPDRPIADNSSAEGRANNRRVEIVVAEVCDPAELNTRRALSPSVVEKVETVETVESAPTRTPFLKQVYRRYTARWRRRQRRRAQLLLRLCAVSVPVPADHADGVHTVFPSLGRHAAVARAGHPAAGGDAARLRPRRGAGRAARGLASWR